MTTPRIAVVDYGVGNIHSVTRALHRCGAEVFLTDNPDTITRANGMVLPGVGAFATGMEGLIRRGLVEPIQTAARRGMPTLGICLGAQLLLTEGHEFGTFAGLDLIPGTVDLLVPQDASVKVPHIGWNTIAPPSAESWQGTLLDGTPSARHLYFIHSYVMNPRDVASVLAQTTYGGVSFTSAVCRDRITGCQFHPEKSGDVGLAILKRFVTQCLRS